MSRLQGWVRSRLGKLVTGVDRHALHDRVPPLEQKFEGVDELGLYLHVPFCRRICPYCPYNKELFDAGLAERYADALLAEIELYRGLIGGRPVTSFYIGGGTPTTMLRAGLDRVLERIDASFDMRCAPHLECHPDDLDEAGLDRIQDLGVRYVSVGVEALQDRHLRTLCRPYTAAVARTAVERTVARGFDCVSVDTMFALPGQTRREVADGCRELVELGADQVSAYPLFSFPYTRWPEVASRAGHRRPGVLRRRRMLRAVERTLYGAGFVRSSVWAFARRGAPRYCSVTVPRYVGLGASGGTYLHDVFYLNTFNVGEYVRAMEAGRSPVALVLDLPPRVAMAKWLYWRIYETRFRPEAFRERFGVDFDRVYGRLMKLLAWGGFLRRRDGEIVLTDRGAYWLHAVQDLFSIDYVARLWGTAREEPWPAGLAL